MDDSNESLRSAFRATWERVFAPLVVMSPVEWSEKIRRMKGGSRFRFAYAPYLRKMYESIFDPTVSETVYELFSRGGKSEVILNAIGFFIDQAPRRILCLWPTNKHGELWSKEALTGELFDETQCLHYLGSRANKRTSGNTLLHKQYPGGLINIFGANAPGDMRRAKGNFLYGDEIDAIAECETDEGDQMQIFRKRGDEFPDTARVFASYPSLKGKSRIHALLEESDWQQWHVKCPRCDEYYVMHRKQLRYDKSEPDKARMECPNERCAALLDDSDRYQMMLGGEWRATRPFKGRRGFQANAMLWPHPVDRARFPGGFLQMLAQQEIDVEKSENPERAKRVLVNTVDAEPYEPPSERKVAVTTLADRREDYDPARELPEGVLVIVAGADVQHDRVEMKVKGYGLNKESWAIAYKVFRGSWLDPMTRNKVDRFLIDAAWKTKSGRMVQIKGMGLDSGYRPTEVYDFCRARFRRNVFAFKGSSQLAKKMVTKPTLVGKPGTWLYEIGTNEAKDIIYQRLELEPMKDPITGQAVFPHGFMHFPRTEDFDLLYFTGLTVENSYMKRATDGEFYRFFEKPEGARNEPLDTEVYCDALLEILEDRRIVSLESLEQAAREWRENPEKAAEPKAKRPLVIRRGNSLMAGLRSGY